MYHLFKIAFFTAIISGIILIFQLIANFSELIQFINESNGIAEDNPLIIFQRIYTPGFITFSILTALAQITYIILGIVFIGRNNNLPGGEKAIWIIGFLLFGFITGIIFMILAKSRRLVNPIPEQDADNLIKS